MKKTILIIFIMVVAIMLLQYFKSSPFSTLDANNIERITPEQAEALIKEDKNLFILDVRSQAEYNEKHYEKATLIPLDQLEEKINDVPHNKDILIYCRSGARAGKASTYFQNRTSQHIYVLDGFPLYTIK